MVSVEVIRVRQDLKSGSIIKFGQFSCKILFCMYKASGLSYDIIILVKVYHKSYIISYKRDISAEDQSVFLYCRLVAEVKSVSPALLSLDQIRKYAVLPPLLCRNSQSVMWSVCLCPHSY